MVHFQRGEERNRGPEQGLALLLPFGRVCQRYAGAIGHWRAVIWPGLSAAFVMRPLELRMRFFGPVTKQHER